MFDKWQVNKLQKLPLDNNINAVAMQKVSTLYGITEICVKDHFVYAIVFKHFGNHLCLKSTSLFKYSVYMVQ